MSPNKSKAAIQLSTWENDVLVPTKVQTSYSPGIVHLQFLAHDGSVFAQGQFTPGGAQVVIDGLIAAKAEADKPR